MKIVVLVKQVPDPEARVTVREGGGPDALSVEDRWLTSYFDEVALEKALQLRERHGGTVTAVSAGPGRAVDALRRAVAFGADRVAHVDDPALAATDNLGIARALAAFVRKEGADLILCGRAALDDDAGIVGPAVAEFLARPHVADAVEIEAAPCRPGLRVVRRTDRGREIVDLELPAVVTAQKGLAVPRVPAVTGVMKAMRAAIEKADLGTLGLSPADVEPRTAVVSVRPPPARRPVRMIEGDFPENVRTLAALLRDMEGLQASGFSPREPVAGPKPAACDVAWVVVERRPPTTGHRPPTTDPRVRRVSLEALGKLASLGFEPVAVAIGGDVEDAARAAAPYAARVLVAEHPLLADYDGETWARVLADLTERFRPCVVAAGATALGRDLLARTAARLGCGYVADAVDFLDRGAVRRFAPHRPPDPRGTSRQSREVPSLDIGGDLVAVRPVLGGRAYVEVAFCGPGPRLVSVRPGAFAPPAPGAAGTVERVEPAVGPPRVRVAGSNPDPSGRVDLADADAVVAGGRGVRCPEGFAAVECLADALGAAVGASRAAVDAGWRDHGCQIGKSGRVVSPKIYVALGVSGAVHHRMGMDSARTVVVVNSDPNAPFFKHADYGIVGDLFRIAPALAEEIRRMRDG